MTDAFLKINPRTLSTLFDVEPFEFQHSLSGLSQFKFDSLHALAEKYRGHRADYYIAGSAKADTEFNSLTRADVQADEAMEQLDSHSYRIILQRPENYDAEFRDLMDGLFGHVLSLLGKFGREQVNRLQSSILISSGASITPFHFDPEVGFFSQIEGEKIYHVYSPAVVSEAELERFYVRGYVQISQIQLDGRDASREHVFTLRPGKGFHQPQNAPHWVETRDRSISYTFVFETKDAQAHGRARGFNHLLRTIGLEGRPPGSSQTIDSLKAGLMQAVIPLRKGVGSALKVVRKG